MALEVQLDQAVKASSGALMCALGIAILALRPATAGPRSLAAHLLAYGAGFVAVNLLPDVRGQRIAGFANVTALVALVAYARAEQKNGARARWMALGLLSGALASTIGVRGLALSDPVVLTNVGFLATFVGGVTLAGLAGGVAAAAAERAARASEGDRGALFVALGLAAYPLVYFAANAGFAEDATAMVGWVGLPAFLGAIVLLARAGRRAAPRLGPALSLVVAAAAGVLAAAAHLPNDPGVYGVTRIIGVALIAYGVFRRDAFGLRLGSSTSRTGLAASVFLAVLFIVAQVAQNFLSAQYGLLMGGVVAGALLVAAKPIERALEARHAPRAPLHAEHEHSYRLALRAALADGALTAAEEEHLAELAEHLELPARSALRLRREVEEELGTRLRIG